MTTRRRKRKAGARPTRVTIMGYPFEVRWVDKPSSELHSSFGAIGSTDVTEQRLEIAASGQGQHQERDTVLHEIVHAIIRMSAHKDDFKNDERGEATVYALATGLLGVLRANPALVAYLTEQL